MQDLNYNHKLVQETQKVLDKQQEKITSSPDNNDMFTKSVHTNAQLVRNLHIAKRTQRENLGVRFQSIHANNKRKDAPYQTMKVVDREQEDLAAKQMEKINATNQMKENQKLADQKRKKDEIKTWLEIDLKNKQEVADNTKFEHNREQASIKRQEQFVNNLKEMEKRERQANIRAYNEDLAAQVKEKLTLEYISLTKLAPTEVGYQQK